MNWVGQVRAALTTVADPERAAAMAAYTKGIAPFLGVPAPVRRAAVRPLGQPPVEALPGIVRELWRQPEREFAYVAVDWLERATRKGPVTLLPLLLELVRSRSWWDTVDGLSACVANLVAAHPDLAGEMDRWVVDPDIWVARVAILHQLGRGTATDEARLWRMCVARAPDREFFIRKAIAWALRDYAWRNPDAVDRFVSDHRAELSALTIREATKNLEKARAALRVRRELPRGASPRPREVRH